MRITGQLMIAANSRTFLCLLTKCRKRVDSHRFCLLIFLMDIDLRTFLFWLAPFFLLTISGTLSTDFSQKHYHKSETNFSDIPEAHSFIDCEADDSLNEFEEEESVEETEKNSKKSGHNKIGLNAYHVIEISDIFSLKYRTYRIRNSYIHFPDRSINANAPPVIS